MALEPNEWQKIHAGFDTGAEQFGLPERRDGSVLLTSFNIRKLGARDRRSEDTWRFLQRVLERFDLIAIQEVQDDLGGVRHLQSLLGDKYGLVASDITGSAPGEKGSPERLAFLFRWDRVNRTEIASDITFDRASVVNTMYGDRLSFWKRFDEFTTKHADWQVDTEARKLAGRKPKSKPVIHLPRFVTFIRTPTCASFRIPGAAGIKPYEFLIVNAHLLFGRYKDERRMEFAALMSWLLGRARQRDRMHHQNILLFADLNLDFTKVDKRRDEIEVELKKWNKEELGDPGSAKINFPFFDVHDGRPAVFRTNVRLSETYDQIAFLSQDDRLPSPEANATAGSIPDGFDYGVFDFSDFFAAVLDEPPVASMTTSHRRKFVRKFEHEVSDHMPLWVRLALPS
jgi:hypothetical protein